MNASPTNNAQWDIFFSYRTARYKEVKPLLDALEIAGLKVWIDRESVRPFESIDERIKHGLARCRLLVAFYSLDYGQSRACQWELTSAYIAGEQEGDATRRIAVIRDNPANGVSYLQPIALQSGKFLDLLESGDAGGLAACVGALRERCSALTSPIGNVVPAIPGAWYPNRTSPTPFPRFVGRITDLWRLHSALHMGDYPLVTGECGPGVACVTGLGGVGKSMLVEEYAKRFFPRYPGGVIWLPAGGTGMKGQTELPEMEARREAAFAQVARDLGIRMEQEEAGQVASLVWNHLRHKKMQHLVIVDDLPPKLPAEVVRGWIGPADVATTIVTSRGRHYSAIMREVPLDVLDPDDACHLLTMRRAPKDEQEAQAAQAVCGELGNLALAIDVMGARVEHAPIPDPYQKALDRLRKPSVEELERASHLLEVIGETLPTGHEVNVIRTLVDSIEAVCGEALELLRWSAALAPSFIPDWLSLRLAQAASGLNEEESLERFWIGLADAQRMSLVDRMGSGESAGYRVHVLVLKAVCTIDAKQSLNAVSFSREVLAALFSEETAGDNDTLQRCDQVLLHAEAVADEISETGIALIGAINFHEFRMGRFTSATRYSQRWIAALTASHGENSAPVLHARVRLATTELAAGFEQKSCDMLEDLAIKAHQISPPDPVLLATIDVNLGNVLTQLGRHEEAIARISQWIPVFVKSDREMSRAALSAKTNLAWAQMKGGHIAQAQRNLEEVMEGRLRTYGPQDEETINDVKNLAQFYGDKGEVERALKLVQNWMRDLQTRGVPSSPSVLKLKSVLGSLLIRSARFSEARYVLSKAFEEAKAVTGGEHPVSSSLAHNMGVAESLDGHFENAAEWYSVAAVAREARYGPEDRGTLKSKCELAQALMRLGKPLPGSELGTLCEHLARTFGVNDPSVLFHRAMRDFALLFEGPPAAEKARMLRESVMNVVSTFGADDPHAQFATHWLSEAVETLKIIVASFDADLADLKAKLGSEAVADDERAVLQGKIGKAEVGLRTCVVAMMALDGQELTNPTMVVLASGPVLIFPDEPKVQ